MYARHSQPEIQTEWALLLVIHDSHLAQVHRSYGQALDVVSFLSGFDHELLQEEGNNLRVWKISRFPLFFGFTPSVQLHTHELPRVDRLLGQESGEPRVVQPSELIEITSLVGHQP